MSIEITEYDVAYWQRRAERAEAEILVRAEKDAEDTHRLQRYCNQIFMELQAARAYIQYTYTAYHSDANQVELWAKWHDAKVSETP